MTKIFKYPLPFFGPPRVDSIQVMMPRGAEVLTLQVQDEVPCIWARVDPGDRERDRTFVIYETAEAIDDRVPHVYIGTFQVRGGAFVFHVYEVPTRCSPA